ncbi:MAG: dipeptidase [Anaerolineae bacterium]|uniref:dipeptidase n=1 Tax=Candidatus Amarolinea dominans TaxID=3140696 RepID=UPI001D4481FA|nr:dipeptidase [Anaerolineae bacterium]MBK9229369.1 dipeptidase [Anaerolineae bacterium]
MSTSQQLHFDAIVCDGHCDTLGDVLAGTRRLHDHANSGHVDLPRLRAGGVTAQVFACFVPVSEYHTGATRHALQRLDAFHETLAADDRDLLLATGAADIRQAKTSGKIAGLLGLEGAEALAGSLEVLRCFHRLGVRVLGLTWNFRNEVADGVHDSGTTGLTPFGVRVIEESNRIGMVIDVSHLSPAGLTHVLAVSQQPVIASHSNARALCDHIRNLTDAQIEAIAAKGGLIGATFVPIFLTSPEENATLGHVLDHLDYLIRVAGPDHVMIGSDFDGIRFAPPGIEDASHYPALTAGMLARGHDEATVRKVLGLNFLRVLETVSGR